MCNTITTDKTISVNSSLLTNNMVNTTDTYYKAISSYSYTDAIKGWNQTSPMVIHVSDVDEIKNAIKNDDKSIKQNDVVDVFINQISDIKCFNNVCVEVTFKDGTKERAICCPDDTFNFETGLVICLIKKMLSTKQKSGTYMYNKLVKKACKVAEEQRLEKAAKEAEELAKKKKALKEKKRKERRLANRRERRKQELAEAIVLANEIASQSDN
jgi:hypothetical protein